MWDLRTLTAINDRVVNGEPPLTLGRATLEEQPPAFSPFGLSLASRPDFEVENHGSVVVISPENDAAEEYLQSKAPEDATWWYGGLVCEPRYVQAILDDLIAEGFTVRA